MKNKFAIIISTIMLFVPWTILPLRTFDWALESPAAEIMISCYAAFMIFSGIFTIFFYVKSRNVQKGSPDHRTAPTQSGNKPGDKWLQVCAVINSLYMALGIVVFFLIGVGKFL